MAIQNKLASLVMVLPLMLLACSGQEESDSTVYGSESASGTDASMDDATLEPTSATTPCSKQLGKYPTVTSLCAQIDALKKKYAGKDIVIAAIGAISDGAVGGYVVYDYSDLQAARQTRKAPAPLEKKANATETASWGSYGVGAVAIYATDAGNPAVMGYAYGTAGYGPNGGFIILKSDTPKQGKRSMVVPLYW